MILKRMSRVCATYTVLVTGDPVPEALEERGDFSQLIREASVHGDAVHEGAGSRWVAHDVRRGVPDTESCSTTAVVVTGSPARLNEQLPWMLGTEGLLRELVGRRVPVLGICFGHQLLGEALGGRVATNPSGREMGTVDYRSSQDDPVLGSQARFAVNATHVDSVVELPAGARVLGSTQLERHAAVRFSESAWGVQYHPEFDGYVMRHYLRARREALEAERFDVDAALDKAGDTPAGASVIGRFLRWARLRGGVR